ncbi:hypothetical protein N8I51_000569 [Escherichia coli]|nr:hypothetical protein [Escherichia coli]
MIIKTLKMSERKRN